MPVLANTRHELFCQFLFEGKNQTEACKLAGYSPRSAHSTAVAILKEPNVQTRLTELKDSCANAVIMSVAERKAKLSTIARSEWQNKDGITPVPNISAINTLNKMDNIYKHDPIYQDNRSLTINVLDKRTRDHLAGVIDGQYKVLTIAKETKELLEGPNDDAL